MRSKALLAAAAAALLHAACNAADSTGPGAARNPAPPSADGGNGQFGSGGYVPPPDSTPRANGGTGMFGSGGYAPPPDSTPRP